MDSDTVQTPLLLSPSPVEHDHDNFNKKYFFVSIIKLLLKYVMWAVFISWVVLFFISPAEFSNQVIRKWHNFAGATVFGITGSIFLLFSAPILVISIFAVAYLVISGEETEFKRNKGRQYPSFRLWTFPVLVDGPFGVVSAAEFIGILLFSVYIISALYAYTAQAVHHNMSDQLSFEEQRHFFLKFMGLKLGSAGIYCLAFLFLPVARGSVLLRLIDIPFEHAAKYHVWLGHLTMLLFTVHGLFFVILWALEGRLLVMLLEWKDIGIANLPGVISLLAGLAMWVTSLPPVRKWNFELFFYTHQLYVVFVVFLALHVGDFIFCISAGGIFIFMLDRFLRFCQSRAVVELLSAKCLPCGTVELTLSKPAGLKYNALSFVFLQIRELSWLQWHPFSVSSSPLDGKYHMSVLIKVLGKWTENMRTKILNSSEAVPEQELPLKPHAEFTVSVEGPYGHETPYHLMYENLVLVAGGIGISPFLAILSDILHRVREGRPCLPRNISIIWAVKKSSELTLLSTVNMESICPFFSEKLNVDTLIYVTRESEPPLEEGKVSTTVNCPVLSSPKAGSKMSGLVGTGHKLWSGLYLIISTAGLVALMGLSEVVFISPYGITQWWLKGLVLMACMSLSIVVFGGSVIGLWHLWEKRSSERHTDLSASNGQQYYDIITGHQKYSPPDSALINYGVRPDFQEIFALLSKRWGRVNAGVLVCGPPTLQTSVAREIRSHSLRRGRDDTIYHFNSHSFDL